MVQRQPNRYFARAVMPLMQQWLDRIEALVAAVSGVQSDGAAEAGAGLAEMK